MPSFSCTECNYSTSHQDNINKHLRKRHNNTAPVHNTPPKIARYEPIPNIIDPPTNDHLLQNIEHQELSDMLSSQVGFGVTQMTPAMKIYLTKFVNFFEMNNHGEPTIIFDKFTSKTFNAFVILKPTTVVLVFFSDIYAMIVHLS